MTLPCRVAVSTFKVQQKIDMTDNPLPYRHRYAAEIEGYRPGIIKRILLALHLVKPMKGTSKANWHYDNLDTVGSIAFFHGQKDGQRYCRVAFIAPSHTSPVIKHV